jgi:autoinducer 2-degrading protein
MMGQKIQQRFRIFGEEAATTYLLVLAGGGRFSKVMASLMGLRNAGHCLRRTMIQTRTRNFATSPPIAMIVQVEIEKARTDAFLKAMTIDAKGSRTEEGCHTFDLLQDQSDPQKFFFYEVYKDADAVAVHRETPHYKAWADFKAEGGVLSQTVIKADAIDFTY